MQRNHRKSEMQLKPKDRPQEPLIVHKNPLNSYLYY